jgi:hypothetical protein
VKMAVFWDVAVFSLIEDYDVSGELALSIM